MLLTLFLLFPNAEYKDIRPLCPSVWRTYMSLPLGLQGAALALDVGWGACSASGRGYAPLYVGRRGCFSSLKPQGISHKARQAWWVSASSVDAVTDLELPE